MPRVSIILVLALVACRGPVEVALELDESTQSVVIGTERDNKLTVEAIDVRNLDKWTMSSEGSYPAVLTVLEYTAPLSDLDITEGTVAPALDGETDQPLPDADRTQRSVVEAQGPGEWETVTDLSGPVAVFRFRKTTVQDCMEGGGCLVSGQCATPCPDPPVPDPPEPPAAPVFTCPDGWALTAPEDVGDVATCEPYPDGPPQRCALGSIHTPGTSGCVPLGPCETTFAAGLPMDAVYVSAGATNGDGTIGAPYGTIGEALFNIGAEGTIALAPGTYAERVDPRSPVTIVGACAETTIIDGRTTSLTVSSSVSIENVTIQGTRPVSVEASGRLTLDAVAIESSAAYAITTAGVVGGRRVDLRAFNSGLYASGNARVDLAEVVIDETESSGVWVLAGSRVTLEDCHVHRAGASGVSVRGASEVELRRCLISEMFGHAVEASEEGTRVTLEDVVMRDTRGNANSAVLAYIGSVVQGTRVVVDRATGAGIGASGGRLDLTDSVVRNTESQLDTGWHGNGAESSSAGTLTLTRTVLWRNRGTGVLSFEEDAVIRLTDVVINDQLGFAGDGDRGNAIGAHGGRVEVERVLIERAHGFGVLANSHGQVVGTDFHVKNMLPRDSNGAFGRGAEATDGGQLDLTRVLFENCLSVAVLALDPVTFIRLRDVKMTGTKESACFGLSCNVGLADGLSVSLSAGMDVERFDIVDNDQYGVRFANEPDLRMRNGRIAGNAVGIQSVSPEFDFARIAEGVRLEGNDQAFAVFGE